MKGLVSRARRLGSPKATRGALPVHRSAFGSVSVNQCPPLPDSHLRSIMAIGSGTVSFRSLPVFQRLFEVGADVFWVFDAD